MSGQAATTLWIAGKPRPYPTVRLFCFPYAGGSSQLFRKWHEELPPAVEVCPIELPGRNSRMAEPPFTQLGPLVEAIAGGIRSRLDKPFALFGHSVGALIAFELARLLAKNDGPGPIHLFVAACHAPHLPDPYPALHALPESEFEAGLRSLNGTRSEVLNNPELMQLLRPVLRADLEVSETYTYRAGPPLQCPITALGGLQEKRIGRELLQCWSDHTTAAFAVRMLPGDHFFIHTATQLLLRIVSRELTKPLPDE